METSKLDGMLLFLQQSKALLWKNFLLSSRRRIPTILHLTSSFFFILLIFGVDRSIRSRRKNTTSFKDLSDPPSVLVTPIPPCESGFFVHPPCYDFVWSSNSSSTIASIIQNIRLKNPGRPIPSSKVLGFNTVTDAEEWLLENPLKCTGAIHMEERSSSIIAYGIQTNSSSKMKRGYYEDPVFKFQLPLQLAAEREISRFLVGDILAVDKVYFQIGSDGKSLEKVPEVPCSSEEYAVRYCSPACQSGNIVWNVSFKEFSHPSIDVLSIVGFIAPTFLLAASMFGFVIQMSDIVIERELKLRQAMTIMGLFDSAYWTSWFLWEILLGFISSILLILFGMMFGFYIFRHNSFGLLLCLFFLFQVNMAGYAYMLSGFISKASSAKTVGFCVFIVGFLTQLVTYFGFPYDPTLSKGYQIVWSFFPPNLLAIGMFYLGRATTNQQDPGISWAERHVCSFSQPECVLTMDNILRWLTGTFFLWLISALYIDNVLPDTNGVRKPWLYFLQRTYWTWKSDETTEALGNDHISDKAQLIYSDDAKDEDVKAEEDVVKKEKYENVTPTGIAIQVQGLVKTFSKVSWKGMCCKPSVLQYAVKGLWMNIEKDSLFCLLGQNGAGKTTTISCITGVLPITDGNVLVYGKSVRSSIGMSHIRRYMGVCPQFNILWDVLTGLEHLYLFASIKGLHPSHIKKHCLELLERVKLSDVKNVKAENYSGGMKRRLSVAIALIGDPKFVCLDEPTTGMDPVTRRHVWSVIEAAKVGRAIILTTHSMEEADILGDRIAIMTKGELCCIGTPIWLKSRFGEGYIVNIRIQKDHASPDKFYTGNRLPKTSIKCFFKQHLDVTATEESVDLLTFVVPYHKETLLSEIFKKLQAVKDELKIADIHISLTTLEKVFLKMTQQPEGLDESLSNGTTSVTIKESLTMVANDLVTQQDRTAHICVTEVGCEVHHDMTEEDTMCKDSIKLSEINAEEIECAVHHDMTREGSVCGESGSAQINNYPSSSEMEKQKTS